MTQKYLRVRRITGYGCDGAEILSHDVPIDPPDCYGQDPERTIQWVSSYVGVETVTDRTMAIYPETFASLGPR